MCMPACIYVHYLCEKVHRSQKRYKRMELQVIANYHLQFLITESSFQILIWPLIYLKNEGYIIKCINYNIRLSPTNTSSHYLHARCSQRSVPQMYSLDLVSLTPKYNSIVILSFIHSTTHCESLILPNKC